MPYFTTDELRTLPDMDNQSKFPDERLVAAHAWISAIIERECETSFIPVAKTETLDGGYSSALFLSSPYVLSVESVTVDGVPVVVSDVVQRHGVLHLTSGFRWSGAGWNNVVVDYTAGYSETPPADLKEAALRGARNWVLTTNAWSGVDTRATGVSNQDGNITFSVASADGRPTGIPDVDATITAWARKVRVPKVS